MPRPFLDTNILLYAVGIHPDEKRKQRIAEDLIARMDWSCSVQVLQEFFVNATRGGAGRALTDAAIFDYVDLLCRRPVQDMTLALFIDAVDIRRRHKLSYWDSAIIAAARARGCDVLYSEDLNHGQVIEGMRVENPFL